VTGRAAPRPRKEEVSIAAAILIYSIRILCRDRKCNSQCKCRASRFGPGLSGGSTESAADEVFDFPTLSSTALIRIALLRSEKSQEPPVVVKLQTMANAVAMSSLLGSKSAVAARPAAFSGKARTTRVQVNALGNM
jgi:hypothetical protein